MKKFVFVIMPFKHEFDDIYKLGIKAACNELDYYCERVDEQVYDGSMIERIYNQIRCADFIVADMSEKNPNVFFEVGYAFALEKRVILVTQYANDIPFDMKTYFHIIYKRNEIFQLQQNLINRIKNFKNKSDIYYSALPDVLVNGIKISEDTKESIKIKMAFSKEYRHIHIYTGIISLAFYNPSEVLKVKSPNTFGDFNVQFILDKEMPVFTNYNHDLLISNNRRIYMLSFYSLHPNYWDGKNFIIELGESNLEKIKESYNCKIILFLDSIVEFNFKCSFIIEKEED